MQRRHVLGTLAATVAGGATPWAQAQDAYPSKPIRLIVPLAPGGGTDIVSRLVAQEMTRQLGASVVVDNVAGGGTTIATSTVVRAAPDGYTLLTGTPSMAINVGLRRDLKYDVQKDLQPISLLSSVPYVLVAGPSLKVRNLGELLDLAKAKPGVLTYGSPGIGSGGHLAAELMQMLAGVKLTHIPYKGSGPALTDLRGGQIDLLFATSPAATPLIEMRAVTGLAASSARRMRTLPQIPTLAEAGVPGYESASWYGVFAPARTPKAVVTKLHGAVLASLRTPSVMEAIRTDGGEPAPTSPEELQAYLANEIAKWTPVIEKAGIKGG